MCIAIFKPAGASISRQSLQNSWDHNRDGAGIAVYVAPGHIQVAKGFMQWEEFIQAYDAFVTESQPALIHFRISTSGGVSPELTHPFPIACVYEDMKNTFFSTDSAMIHNGIFSGLGGNSHSDTMEYVKDFCYPVRDEINAGSIGVHLLLEHIGRSSRVAIMNRHGEVNLLGSWIHDQGCFWSNSDYRYTREQVGSFDYIWDNEFMPVKKKKVNRRKKSKKAWVPKYRQDNGFSVFDEICPICSAEMSMTYDAQWYCDSCVLTMTMYELHQIRQEQELLR